MPQKFSFYSSLTVYQNLKFIADIYQIKPARESINTIINDLGLSPYRNVQADHLSGGWKQKLALACCLLPKPKLLFLDEPTAGIDPKARKDFWDYLHKISMQNGTTVLVTTHYMDEAEKCTDLAYIFLGKLLYSGSTKDIISFSKVKTYLLVGAREDYQILMEKMQKEFPDILVSLVSNDLRISSRNTALLDQVKTSYNHLQFKSVIPSLKKYLLD